MEKIKNSSLYGEMKNKCKNISWCCFLYKDIENNKIYCEECMKKILKGGGGDVK